PTAPRPEPWPLVRSPRRRFRHRRKSPHRSGSLVALGFVRLNRRARCPDLLEQLRDPLDLRQTDVLLELEVGCELHADLVAEDRPEVAPGRLQAGPRPSVVLVLSHDRI